MEKQKVQHIRNAIIMVSVCQVIFLTISAWHINLNLIGVERLMGFKILDVGQVSRALLLGISSLAITLIYLVTQLLKITQLEKELAIAKVSNKLAQETIKILRAHRHDFLNHLQVIMGYIQIGKPESALTYLKNINSELKDVRIISRLEMPEVAVLLFSKKEEALKHGITMKYHINTDLSNVKISQVDMVRILSNLIDNAIYELKKNCQADDMEKYVKITFNTVGETLFIEVHNSHSVIKNEDKIFKYGYTTKGIHGSGIGLYTVKQLVEEKYGGKINVKSSEDSGTSFIIAV